MKCLVSADKKELISWIDLEVCGEGSLPCVTKLPKFRPTMQCHVGPFLSSNCVMVSMVLLLDREDRSAYGLLDELCDVLADSSAGIDHMQIRVSHHTFSMLYLDMPSVARSHISSPPHPDRGSGAQAYQLQRLRAASHPSVLVNDHILITPCWIAIGGDVCLTDLANSPYRQI